MKAAWYERKGPAQDVLQVGELPDPIPGPGEVRVRLRLSGINPGDTKKRSGWLGSPMPFPLVVPHSDGAGTIDRVGDGVDASRVGERVWVWGAQSYRPMGTAAELTVVPERQAVALPDDVTDEVGACLGIPGITAHRAVFIDGPVNDKTVLVHGVRGAVGSFAAQLALWGGATVIGTVRRGTDLDRARTDRAGLDSADHDRPDLDHASRDRALHLVALDAPDAIDQIRAVAPDGVDHVVEVSLSDNAELDTAVLRVGGVIAAYASHEPRPALPFWPMLFNNLTIHLLGSDDFPADAKHSAAADLTAAAHDGALSVHIAETHPLASIATAHDRVDQGIGGRVLLTID